MLWRAGRIVASAGFVVVAVVVFAGPARAQTAGLAVQLTADQPLVTIDRDAPQEQVLRYELVVTNAGSDVVPGVVVEARLPGAPPVEHVVGDVAGNGEWRKVLEVTLPATTDGGPVDAVAVVRSADGREVTSAPARVDVQVISSAVYDRDEPAAPAPTVAPDVLGATYEQPFDTTLARTGLPLGVLAAMGASASILGALVVRRTTDDG